jgi:hypothetical protein
VFISTGRGGVFIGLQGGVTDLVKSVSHQVLARLPSHVAKRPWGPASTDFQLQIPCYRILESVAVKSSREMLQSGATPWAHWLAAFAHFLVSGTFPG